MRFITALLTLICFGLALPAQAQAQATFAGLQVKGGTTLFVTEQTGQETKGKLISQTDSTLVLQLKDSTRTFTPDELAFVERKGDSLKNGVIVGVAIGILCSFTCAIDLSGGQLVAAVVENALIPIGIDAAVRGRTRIWPLRQKKTKVK